VTSRRPDDRDSGSVTAFVAAMAVAFLAAAGLVVDGGRLLDARLDAGDHAENAARVGAQQIVSIRSGEWHIDPASAIDAANGYLASRGLDGTVRADELAVTVTVRTTTELTLLGAVAPSSKTVSATRTATAVDQ
jgi:Putative Flp pilus-assembly TadE/G-like